MISLIVDGKHEYWAPADISAALIRLGWSAPRQENPDKDLSESGQAVVQLMRRFARKTHRANTLVLDISDHRSREIISDQHWASLLRILLEAGLATEQSMAASGPRKTRLRLDVPADAVIAGRTAQGAAPQIRRFWDAVEKL